ncbi:MAG: acetylpolyamine amidohydrolase [Rhodobacteraceae bacterium]|nr:acetylpolyamine amidohydrolase [Paracoccaceae bacterium]
MKTIYSPLHAEQNAETEPYRGRTVPGFEIPRRAQLVLDRVREVGLGPVLEPDAHGLDPLTRVHSPEFVDFLATIRARWEVEVGDIPAVPSTWMLPRGRSLPNRRAGAELGRFAIDMSSPILAGTWTAARASADCALTGAALVGDGERVAFALCRPPGHHAGRDSYGGYCFLNNAAIAAQSLIDGGMAKVAVLDVDYHHGNGTQDIFWTDDKVLTVSIHADPDEEYPYHLGRADEVGEGAGEGVNLNLPLPLGTEFAAYEKALNTALERIAAQGAEAIVVSLGVDTFGGDPISHFRLVNGDYLTMGAAIAKAGLPTLFVMEGGYAVEDIGVNAVNVLTGFEEIA